MLRAGQDCPVGHPDRPVQVRDRPAGRWRPAGHARLRPREVACGLDKSSDMTRHHFLMISLLALTACAGAATSDALVPAPIRQAAASHDERAGLVLADEGYGDGATSLVYLDQGWRTS